MVISAVEPRHGLYPLRAVDRVCDIIDLLAEHPEGVTLSVLSVTLDLPKSSAFRYLAALEVRGFVMRSRDGMAYRLGSPFFGAAPVSTDRLVAVGRTILSRLTSADAPVGMLAMLDGQSVRYLLVSSPPTTDPRVPRAGDWTHLHTSAVGKAIASQLTDDIVLAIVNAAGMAQPTSSTLSSPTSLLRELNRIRGEGFAVSDGELHGEIRGVAVPIGGDTVALSVAGFSGNMTPDLIGGLVRRLRRAAWALAKQWRS